MAEKSAGLLPFRVRDGAVDVLIGHPGGPFWARKDDGAWSILKGEFGDDELPEDVARREFEEETGCTAPPGPYLPLGSLTQSGGKTVTAFAVESDIDVSRAVSNTFEMEWPAGSGRICSFPEVDRVEWMSVDCARVRLLARQREFLDRLPRRP